MITKHDNINPNNRITQNKANNRSPRNKRSCIPVNGLYPGHIDGSATSDEYEWIIGLLVEKYNVRLQLVNIFIHTDTVDFTRK